jgi:coenzyme F420-dependent glucose-6-phosphate dehydrogenase
MMDLDGTTVICLQGIGDHDPLTSIRRYGQEVLPALRRGGDDDAARDRAAAASE